MEVILSTFPWRFHNTVVYVHWRGNSYRTEQLFSSHDDYHSLESKTTSKFCIALELLLGNWANFLQSHRVASTSSSISLHLLVFTCYIWLWGIHWWPTLPSPKTHPCQPKMPFEMFTFVAFVSASEQHLTTFKWIVLNMNHFCWPKPIYGIYSPNLFALLCHSMLTPW